MFPMLWKIIFFWPGQFISWAAIWWEYKWQKALFFPTHLLESCLYFLTLDSILDKFFSFLYTYFFFFNSVQLNTLI